MSMGDNKGPTWQVWDHPMRREIFSLRFCWTELQQSNSFKKRQESPAGRRKSFIGSENG